MYEGMTTERFMSFFSDGNINTQWNGLGNLFNGEMLSNYSDNGQVSTLKIYDKGELQSHVPFMEDGTPTSMFIDINNLFGDDDDY